MVGACWSNTVWRTRHIILEDSLQQPVPATAEVACWSCHRLKNGNLRRVGCTGRAEQVMLVHLDTRYSMSLCKFECVSLCKFECAWLPGVIYDQRRTEKTAWLSTVAMPSQSQNDLYKQNLFHVSVAKFRATLLCWRSADENSKF